MPVKKGLVAPQNIFIQTIIKKFDGSPDRNFVLGNAQVSNLPIIYCNDGFCALTGYSRAELVQKRCSCDFLCGPETDKLAARDVINALRATEEKHAEILYYRKDGSSFLCSVLIAPVKNEEGHVVMYIMNLEDVTWSPNKEEFMPTSKPFNIRQKLKKAAQRAAAGKTKSQPRNICKDADNSSPPSGTSDNDVNAPLEGVPLMSVEPPSLPDLELAEPSLLFRTSRQPSPKTSSSMNELSSRDAVNFVRKLQEVRRHSSLDPDTEAFDLLQLRPLSNSRTSESNLWKTNTLSDQNRELRGSAFKITQGMQLQPKKKEKVAQVMSLGADVLPEYKLQAPKIHPWTILHFSLFKAFWDWIVLFLVIYTAIVTPYMAAFVLIRDNLREVLDRDPETRIHRTADSGSDFVLVIIDYIVDVMFIIDIFINFRTTFVDSNDEVVSHPCRIAVHYLKTWFLIDLVAAIPFELLIMITNTNQTTTLIGLLKTARLLRLVRVARKLDQYFEYGVAVLCLLMCSFALLAHWLACIWYAIGNLERGTNGTVGWLDNLAENIDRPYSLDDPESGPDLRSKYVTALYFTLSSLTSVGFGNVSPNTNAEKIFSICVMLVGSLFYAAIFGNVAAIIARLYSSTSRFHVQIRKVREFIRFHQIPNPLRQRIEDYAHHIWSYTYGMDMDQVLKNFPECLQADICLHMHSNLLNSYPAFNSASQGCLRAFALKFKTTHLPPGDYIFHEGDEISQLYFIMRGTVEVLRGDVIMAILGKCDTFGENFASDFDLPMTHSDVSIRALTYCDLHSISKEDLTVILRQYPSFRESFKEDMEVTYNVRNSDSASHKEKDTLDSMMLAELDDIKDSIATLETRRDFEAETRHAKRQKDPDLIEPGPHWRTSQNTNCCTENVADQKRGAGRSKEPVLAGLSPRRECCVNCHVQVELKLEGLSYRLQNMEKKLAMDMKAMMELLQKHVAASSKEMA